MEQRSDTDHFKSPFEIPNIRYFIAFRIFFNSRFYYPIFTILFLDFGLSLEQFALLNVAWAVTIVLFEVPSGALADVMGRKNLLVATGVLMVIEMALLCFAPRGNPDLLFAIFVVNRVLSGMAEAAASGADEALAFDTLKQYQLDHQWGAVLERLMRYRAMVGMVAMSLGAAIYDPSLVGKVLSFVGIDLQVTQADTMRLPLFLTFVFAIATLLVTWRMQEVELKGEASEASDAAADTSGTSVLAAFKLTFQAGNWIRQTPFALILIAAGVLFDNVIRMVLTLNSQYYRLIQIPEATFGVISAVLAAMGLVMPRLSRHLSEQRSPRFNFLLLSAMTCVGLMGMTYFWPYLGLLPVVVLLAVMYMMNFFLSHYLNRITSSHQRATVLSFKGLSINLAYGLAGWLYALLLSNLRPRAIAADPQLGGQGLENAVFIDSIGWFPGYFIATLVILVVYAKWRLRGTDEYKAIG